MDCAAEFSQREGEAASALMAHAIREALRLYFKKGDWRAVVVGDPKLIIPLLQKDGTPYFEWRIGD